MRHLLVNILFVISIIGGGRRLSTSKRREKFATEQKDDFVGKEKVIVRLIKDDRRSKRTRQLLGEALVELLLEKRFDAITVQDILNRANIGRSTFYEHYTDIEDLLMSEIQRVIRELEEHTAV